MTDKPFAAWERGDFTPEQIEADRIGFTLHKIHVSTLILMQRHNRLLEFGGDLTMEALVTHLQQRLEWVHESIDGIDEELDEAMRERGFFDHE